MFKKNLLPQMQKVKMTDKDGGEFSLWMEVRRGENGTYVFVSDTNQLGSSRLAQDTVYYFGKLCQRLNLDTEDTVFYRHIYQENMGSMFGRFHIDWDAKPEPSYKFQMLTNIDELQSVTKLIESTVFVDLAELTARPAPRPAEQPRAAMA